MKTARTSILFAAILLAVGTERSRAQTWSSFDYPSSIQTQARGISGNNIVGNYVTSFSPAVEHGYLKNGSIYTPLNDPLAGTANGQGTVANGIATNGNIVGYYVDSSGVQHGFLNDGSYHTLDDPSAGTFSGAGTLAFGISSSNGNIVGYFIDSSNKNHGFVYNGTTYTALNDPNASTATNQGTFAYGINNANGHIVGEYIDSSSVSHGFLYSGSTYSTLDYPGALDTYAFGVDGSNDIIVGIFLDSSDRQHGFLYNGTWTELDYNGSVGSFTQARGIDGNNIVGDYQTTFDHGFLAAVPEPSSILLGIFGLLTVLCAGQHRGNALRANNCEMRANTSF